MAEEKENKIGVHLDDRLYRKLIKEVAKRKLNRDDGASISGVIRDALGDFFAAKRAA